MTLSDGFGSAAITRRVTQAIGVLALFAFGGVLMLVATGAMSGARRDDAADWFRTVARPDLPDAAVALIGLGLAGLGGLLLAAQLAPRGRHGHDMHLVSDMPDGETWIRGRGVLHAVEHAVTGVRGVVGAKARWSAPSVIDVRVQVDDVANVEHVDGAVRDTLSHPFWIDLGIADVAVDIVVVHEGGDTGRVV